MASLAPFTGNLGMRNAAHLLRRITFGPTKTEIDSYTGLTVTQALDNLFSDVSTPSPPVDVLTGSSWLPVPDPEVNSDEQTLTKYYMAWHMERMRNSGLSAKERIVYFYHTHMPVQYSIVRKSSEIYYQNALYRFYALGSFKTMFTKITMDNAMLKYIDNHLNESGSPNENYARELMELYSIGKGPQIGNDDYTNYTEADVKEVSKVISGYKVDDDLTNIDTDTGIPRCIIKTNADGQAYLHNSDVKTFSAAFGNASIQPNDLIEGQASEAGVLQELNDLMDLIFGQEETAKFLCRKIYRQFVYYIINDEIENDIITPLANTFRTNNYNIVPVLRQLLSSQHFFDADNGVTTDDHIGAIIKSPVELVLGTLRFFDINLPTDIAGLYDNAYINGLLKYIDQQGMSFYEPIDVAGYSAYHQTPTYNRYWITPNNLARRYEFGELLVDGTTEALGFSLDIENYVNNNISNPADPDVVVTELTDYMLPIAITSDRHDYFVDILTDKYSAEHWKEEWENARKNGDNKATRAQLESLIVAIMQSPEYQLC